MITIYKNKKDIPQNMEYIELNDVYFNQKTASILDERAEKIIEEIDGSMRVGKYKIRSRFDDIIIDIDKLSAGCKTALNVLYNPDKIFCLKECGNNALEVVYSLEQGNVYSDYALIPFDMKAVNIKTASEEKIISDYEELKEWWGNEE